MKQLTFGGPPAPFDRDSRTLRIGLAPAMAAPRPQADAGIRTDRPARQRTLPPGPESCHPASETPAEPPAPATGASAIQSLNPDLSFIADVAAAWFSAKPPLESGEHDPRNNGFTLQQLELAASSAVDPYFRFDSFIVFKLPRPPAAGRPIGTGEAGGVEIEEVYATTTSLPANLQLRVGQFLTRFGRFNPTHPHTWDFVDQPLEIGRLFSPDGNRGLGFELSYLTPLPWYVELVGSMTQDSALDVSHSGNLQGTVALKQFFSLSDDWSLMWGLSGIAGSDPSAPADPDGRARSAVPTSISSTGRCRAAATPSCRCRRSGSTGGATSPGPPARGARRCTTPAGSPRCSGGSPSAGRARRAGSWARPRATAPAW